jgi:cytoskeletal protein CcmA (bactofilin family)
VFRNLRHQKSPLTSSVKSKPLAASGPSEASTDTILGSSATLEGTLKSEGNVRIDGTFDGDIATQGTILIGSAGKVEGDLEGREVTVRGVVRGDIEAKRIAVQRTGRVWGDLTTTALTTEEGGFIQGVITMQSEDAEETVDAMLSDLEAEVAEVMEEKAKK